MKPDPIVGLLPGSKAPSNALLEIDVFPTPEVPAKTSLATISFLSLIVCLLEIIQKDYMSIVFQLKNCCHDSFANLEK
ncbi:hypothetical protein TRFO_31192 [Tritrichomonas foetus]|uniref:Uncharacterized protein n=1 Tax=Tritrichomonas foetus TaxID=1144522 RepID=A0A1J4JS69_9EUKA|nr:hypothetical protein TRFO_31192 [Tritrichomonas foetus]|eukprot:OHT01899.1 hypothetical protein TRFO_31192 [Tritrichomonas foetus]